MYGFVKYFFEIYQEKYHGSQEMSASLPVRLSGINDSLNQHVPQDIDNCKTACDNASILRLDGKYLEIISEYIPKKCRQLLPNCQRPRSGF